MSHLIAGTITFVIVIVWVSTIGFRFNDISAESIAASINLSDDNKQDFSDIYQEFLLRVDNIRQSVKDIQLQSSAESASTSQNII